MIVFDVLSWAFLVVGGVFCVIGGIGLIRLPDFYARCHAGGVTDTLGAGLILLGLSLQAVEMMVEASSAGEAMLPAGLVLVKLVSVLVFLLMTSPIAGHATVRAAWNHGLQPNLHEDRR